MGRIEINTADIPQSRRGTPFTDEEVSRLVQEITERKDIIYGTATQPALPHKVRQAWEEIAEIISSLSNIKRSADQCRKRFNDIKRRGQKMVVTKKRGRPPKNRPKLDAGEVPDAQFEDPDDMEFEAHEFEYEIPAPMDDDDPDYEPSPKKREMRILLPKEISIPKEISLPKEVPMVAQPDPLSVSPRNPSPIPQVPVQSMPPSPVRPKSESPPPPPSPKPQSPPVKPQVSPAPRAPGSAGPKPLGSAGPKPKLSGPRPPGSAAPKPHGPSNPKPPGAPGSKPPGAPGSKPPGPPGSKPPGPPGSKPPGPPGSKPPGPPGPRPPGHPLSKPKVVMVRKPGSDPAARPPPGTPRPPHEEQHPFLELQQNGFNMLKRELSGFRDSVMSLNTRLNHLEVALRPIGHIADSLSRIANAVERLTCPPEEN